MDENFLENPNERVCVRPNAAYHFAIKVTDIDFLMNIFEDRDAMNMQVLVVSDRILGPNQPETIMRLQHRAAQYAKLGAYQRFVDLMMYVLRSPD